MGPKLTEIGKKLNRAQLLESILEPSKRIDPQSLTYLVETVEGRLLTDLLVERDDSGVVLKDLQNRLIRIPSEKKRTVCFTTLFLDAGSVVPRHDHTISSRFSGIPELIVVTEIRGRDVPIRDAK